MSHIIKAHDTHTQTQRHTIQPKYLSRQVNKGDQTHLQSGDEFKRISIPMPDGSILRAREEHVSFTDELQALNTTATQEHTISVPVVAVVTKVNMVIELVVVVAVVLEHTSPANEL